MEKTCFEIGKRAVLAALSALLFAAAPGPVGANAAVAVRNGGAETRETGKVRAVAGLAPGEREGAIRTVELSFDVSRFELPEDARSLIVVEGFAVNGGREVYQRGDVEDQALWNRARITAFLRDGAAWRPVLQSAGVMGWGGMSGERRAGDGTTPIGLWRAGASFGHGAPEAGFPADYVRIVPEAREQYWSDRSNRLERSASISEQSGERLWEDWAKEIYDYCLDSGFNRDLTYPGLGSALFLHCTKAGKPSTAGCVAMDPAAMKEILKLRAAGGCYVAQAPEGQFETVYGAFSETGAPAPGAFTNSSRQLPPTETVILR